MHFIWTGKVMPEKYLENIKTFTNNTSYEVSVQKQIKTSKDFCIPFISSEKSYWWVVGGWIIVSAPVPVSFLCILLTFDFKLWTWIWELGHGLWLDKKKSFKISQISNTPVIR